MRWAGVLVVCALLAGLCAGGVAPAAGRRVPSGAERQTRAATSSTGQPPRLLFVSFARNPGERRLVLVLAESIRTFGGGFRSSRIRLYVAPDMPPPDRAEAPRWSAVAVETPTARPPSAAVAYPYAARVSVAAQAEADAEAACDILVWMEPDAIVLDEPGALALGDGIAFGYRPVPRALIGSAYAQPPDRFWTLVYARLAVSSRAVFPMVASVDRSTIRPLFASSLVAVRPRRGILRQWLASLVALSKDPDIAEACRLDLPRAMFLHQAALAGAVLRGVERGAMAELPATYNYPLSLYDWPEPLDRFVTVRYENLLTTPGWRSRVRGSADILTWLRARFPESPSE